MRAKDFYNFCRQTGTWVNWAHTSDAFMHGDPETKVEGIAVTWLATNSVIKKASDMGCNFVISHEGAFYPNFLQFNSEKEHHKQKHCLMDELGVVLFRCHDTLDRMPNYGVRDRWADFLGFDVQPCNIDSFYKLSKVGNLSVEKIAKLICDKTSQLGQPTIKVISNNTTAKIGSLVSGTGAITELAKMQEMGAELIIATEDGIHSTYCGLWALDLDISVIVVEHSVSELPGMFGLVQLLNENFPDIFVEYIPCEFPSREVNTQQFRTSQIE